MIVSILKFKLLQFVDFVFYIQSEYLERFGDEIIMTFGNQLSVLKMLKIDIYNHYPTIYKVNSLKINIRQLFAIICPSYKHIVALI